MENLDLSETISRRIRAGELPSAVLRSLMAQFPGLAKNSLASDVRSAFPEAEIWLVHFVWRWEKNENDAVEDTRFDFQLIRELLAFGVALPWTMDDCKRESQRIAPLLAERHRIAQMKAVSFENLKAKIEAFPGRVDCIEVLWDGDTQGWFIDMFVIMDSGSAHDRHWLGQVSHGGDFRLFTGQVPPWPEAEYANRTGRQLAEHFGAEFYFPSPNEPNDDCPRWLELER